MIKRLLAFILLGCLILLSSGCGSSSISYGEEYVPGQDDPATFLTMWLSKRSIVPAEKGYYLMVGAFVFYVDENMENPMALCNRPNCRHERESDPQQVWKCNAYFGGSSQDNRIAFYDGSLYICATFDSSTGEHRICRIFRVSADGSTREKVLDFPDEISEFYIHRGYLYTIQKIEGKDTFCRYSLADRSHPQEILYQSSHFLRSIRLLGNRVYFEETKSEEEVVINHTYCYYLNTKELTSPFSLQKNETLSFYTALDNQLYYKQAIYSIKEFPEDDEPHDLDLYQSDLDGKNPKLVLTGKKMYYALVDRNYIFEVQMEYRKDKEGKDPENHLIVYDHQGKQLAQHPIEAIGDRTSDYVTGDGTYLYVYSSNGIYKVDKKKLAEGQVEKTPVIELDSTVTDPIIQFNMDDFQ